MASESSGSESIGGMSTDVPGHRGPHHARPAPRHHVTRRPQDWETYHPRFFERGDRSTRELFWLNRITMPEGLVSEMTPPVPDGEIHLSWVNDGQGIARVEGMEPQGFGPGAMMIASGGTRLALTIDVPTMITHLGFFAEDYTLSASLAHRAGTIFSVDDANIELLNEFAEAAMSHIDGPSEAATSLALNTMSAMLESLLQSTFAAPALDHRSRQDVLHRAAIAEFTRTYTDPSTTIDSVALRLQVSRKHLERVFRAADDSPYSALRALRAARARSLLAELPRPSQQQITGIALASGFTSVRNMRRAIAATTRPAAEGHPLPEDT